MTNHTSEASPFIYARIAGVAYLLIIVISVLNVSLIDSRLIESGNDMATANNILADDLLFRIGMACVLIIYTNVVILSVSLYAVLKTVDRHLALLAMILRSGEAILGVVTVLISLVVLLLLNDKGYSTASEIEQLHSLAGLLLSLRTAGLDIVLLFVGLGGTAFCYLFFKSKFVPRILAIWGLVTYLSMIMLSFVSILLPNHPVIVETVLYAMGASFELIFGFWLLVKGISKQEWDNYASQSPPV